MATTATSGRRWRRMLLVISLLGLTAGGLVAPRPAAADPAPAPAPATTIAGTVVDTEGTPISGAWLEVRSNDGPWHTATRPDGSFRFAELPPGTYPVAIAANGHLATEVEVTVAAGAATPLHVELELGSSVRGVLTHADGAPFADRWVVGWQDDGSLDAVRTGPDGSFQLAGYTAGPFYLHVSGHVLQTGDLVIPPTGDLDGLAVVATPVPVPARVDTSITSRFTHRSATVGQTLTQHLTVHDQPATEPTRISQEVPAGVEVLSATWGWFQRPCAIERSASRTDVICTLPAGATPFVTVSLRPQQLGSYVLVARLATLPGEIAIGDNDVYARLPVVASPAPASLHVEALPAVSEVFAGERFTHTYVVTNQGATAVDAATLAVDAPSGGTLVTAATGWFSVPCAIDGDGRSCPLGPIDAGGAALVVLTLEAGASGTVSTSATATAPSIPPSNEAGATATVVATATVPDVRIDQREAPMFENKLGPFPTKVLVTSDGPRTATDVAVSIEIPDGVVIDRATFGAFGLPCTIAPNEVRCAIGDLRGEQVITLQHHGEYDGAFYLRSTVTAAADRDPGNNSDDGFILPRILFG